MRILSCLGITDGIIHQEARQEEQKMIYTQYMHSRSKQRTDKRVLVLTLKSLALKKPGFSPVKNTSKSFFDFCLPLFNATFQCGPYIIFKKKTN